MIENLEEYIKINHPTYNELVSFFNVDKVDLDHSLLYLEKNGNIDKVKDRYYLTEELNLIPATIAVIKEKCAFASVNEENRVYISIDNLKNAFLDDRVLLKKVSNQYEKEDYEVVKIVKRARENVVGIVLEKKNIKVLLVQKVAKNDFLFIVDKNSIDVKDGEVVQGKIKKISSHSAIVEVERVIGNKNDIGIDVSKIILFNNAPLYFPEEVIEEVKNIPTCVLKEDKKGREDFTNHLIVTIDGESAKDFDDAVEVTKVDDIYYVGVHIADVSYYVKEGSAIDKEALNRATSLYVQDRVVPMLPFELSNGICSLNPNVERLVTSCLFSIDSKGNILNTEICKSVIKSKYRLTYTYVNQFLNNEKDKKEKYNPLEEMLINLKEVSDLIRKRRKDNGGLELVSTELEFSLNDKGIPLKIKKREQDVGESLIEDLMIKANEIVAETIQKTKLPMVYRIHEHPKAKKLDSFKRISLSKGYPLNVDSLNCTNLEIAEYLNNIEEKDKKVLSSMLLRCLAKAKYSITNKKHFGLASDCYTHFTSPIRRYPDLIVHRLINQYIIEKKLDYEKQKDLLTLNADLCSQRERRALTIEREVEALLCSKYMKKNIGNEYDSEIVSFTPQGMFVEIENGIQGFIPFESISGDYFIFDEETYCCYGTRKRTSFHLGDKIKVICTNVDISKSQITFALISQSRMNKIKKGKKKIYGKTRYKNSGK